MSPASEDGVLIDYSSSLNDRGLSIPEAKECVKDRREWRRIVGGDVDDPG